MKPTIIISIIALAIGFASGWLVKSASRDLEGFSPAESRYVSSTPPPKQESPADTFPDQEANPAPDSTAQAISENPVPATDSGEQIDRAKWSRLMEVLGLSSEQAKTLSASIEQSLSQIDQGEEPLEDFEKAGTGLQAKIISLLTTRQQAAFKAMQARDRENHLESQAQKSFLNELGGLDLDPDQRNQALDLLRQDAEQEFANISDGTRLLLSSSFLPIGKSTFSEEGIVILRKLRPTENPTNPEALHLNLFAHHKAELQRKMTQFEGILTPGQLARYQASLAEYSSNMDKIRPQQ
ncbi:MAG: hypothetical protein H7Y36_02785 [Armatimonadetes bacterium]|nr:hypothetical protein [Akkermansiaceae bacterium]